MKITGENIGQPTEKQLALIRDMENSGADMFLGTTAYDASNYIETHIDEYRDWLWIMGMGTDASLIND